MKRLIMRAFWGVNDKSHRLLNRKYRVDGNIKGLLKSKNNTEFITYVWGKDNYEHLTKLGFKCVLVYDEPFQWDLIKYQYRHKLEALKYAMEVEGVDELLHVDWDCVPLKKADDKMWEQLSKKDVFQSNLMQYHRIKAKWRKSDRRKIPNGGCVYIKDKNVPAELIKVWETMKGPSAEPPMAKFTDNLMGGWKGINEYWKRFEMPICNLHRSAAFPIDLIKTKDVYFVHYQG